MKKMDPEKFGQKVEVIVVTLNWHVFQNSKESIYYTYSIKYLKHIHMGYSVCPMEIIY